MKFQRCVKLMRFLVSTYRSDGDATVDVGGAVEGIKADAVPLILGMHFIRETGRSLIKKRRCTLQAELNKLSLLTFHAA